MRKREGHFVNVPANVPKQDQNAKYLHFDLALPLAS